MLRIESCPELGGTLVKTDSLVDCVQQVVDHCKIYCPHRGKTSSWEGREFSSWDEIGQAFLKPWEEGMEKVKEMLDEIKALNLAPPESLKRKREWSELDGEVDVDRALGGSNDFLRRQKRRNVTAPRNVAVLCNIGNIGSFTAEQIFWRGAAAIAAIDLLENAGYQCEVWAFNNARNCFGYGSGGGTFFFTTCLKECGQHLDLDRLANGLSAWFFRTIVFGLRDVVKRGSFAAGASHNDLGKWVEKMDISEGITKVHVPSVFDKEGAVKVAKKILEDVVNPEKEVV